MARRPAPGARRPGTQKCTEAEAWPLMGLTIHRRTAPRAALVVALPRRGSGPACWSWLVHWGVTQVGRWCGWPKRWMAKWIANVNQCDAGDWVFNPPAHACGALTALAVWNSVWSSVGHHW